MSIETQHTVLAAVDCYTEGPVRDAHGNIFFTCPATGEVKKLDRSGRLSTWATLTRPNGQVILSNGEHLVCDSEASAIYRFSENGKLIGAAIQDQCDDHTFTTPNDIVADKRGGYYFSDSVRHDGTVYYFHPKGIQRRVIRNLDYPNGLALSNDKRYLFIAESYRNRILKVEISEPGRTITGAEVFCDLPVNNSGMQYDNLPDGLKIDKNENLWVAHYGMGKVHVIDFSGNVVKSIDTGFRCTSNLFLSGHECIITGGDSEDGPGGVISISF